MSSSFKLRSTLDRSAPANADDVLDTKKALHSIGYYQTPKYGMTPYTDETLFDGIKRFQKDFGLQRDGVMKPKGPTERTLSAATGARASGETGPFVSSVAVADAAVIAHATVGVLNTVVVASAGKFGRSD